MAVAEILKSYSFIPLFNLSLFIISLIQSVIYYFITHTCPCNCHIWLNIMTTCIKGVLYVFADGYFYMVVVFKLIGITYSDHRYALLDHNWYITIVLFLIPGASCSSVVRAFAHGAMGRRIDASWWTHWPISRSSQCTTTGVTKAVACAILCVGWCI